MINTLTVFCSQDRSVTPVDFMIISMISNIYLKIMEYGQRSIRLLKPTPVPMYRFNKSVARARKRGIINVRV
jgi:hypothetical protein